MKGDENTPRGEAWPHSGHDMRFLSGQTKAEGERFEADGAVFLIFGRVVAGDDGEGCMCHESEGVGERVVVLGVESGSGAIGGGRDKGAK